MMASLHDRMPVILPKEQYEFWLDGEFKDRQRLESLLVPCPDDELQARPVSKLVNKVINDERGSVSRPALKGESGLLFYNVLQQAIEDRKLLAGNRFDRGRHRSLASLDQKISAERMNLIPFQFGVFPGRGQANGTTCRVDQLGNLKTLGERMTKNLPHHQHHVFVGMIIVVPQNDVITGLFLGSLVPLLFDGRFDDWFGG